MPRSPACAFLTSSPGLTETIVATAPRIPATLLALAADSGVMLEYLDGAGERRYACRKKDEGYLSSGLVPGR